MRTLLSVFAKEVVDNFRDRRTLVSALIMGPLFGPMLFAFVINLSIERSLSAADDTMDLPVIGQEHAPNLVRYIESRNINIVAGPADRDAAIAAVTSGALDVEVVSMMPLGGGDVADSYRVVLDDGATVFAKTKIGAVPGFFTTEAAGLSWLRSAEAVAVPAVLAVSDDPAFLILQVPTPSLIIIPRPKHLKASVPF